MTFFKKTKLMIIVVFCLIIMCFSVSCGDAKKDAIDDVVGVYGIDVLEYKNFDNETQSLLGLCNSYILVIRKDGKATLLYSIDKNSDSIDTTYTYVEENEIVKNIVLEEMRVIYINNFTLNVNVYDAIKAKFSFDYEKDTISDTKIIDVKGNQDSIVNPYKDRTIKYVFKKYYANTSNSNIRKVKEKQIKDLA